MKRKVIFIQILFCFIYVLASILFAPNASANLWQGLHDCTIYEGNWEIKSNTLSASYETLPVFFYPETNEQDIRITKQLSGITNGDSIGFFTFQQQIRIEIDGEEIYNFAPPSYIKSQTPGNKWHFIPLDENDNGFILNTIHSSEGCYSYTKDIVNGNCDISLSPEEQKAIDIARSN